MPEEDSFSKFCTFLWASAMIGMFLFCATTLFYVYLIKNVAVIAIYYGAIVGIISAIIALPTIYFLDRRGYI